jgi:hypothetical protein
MRTAAFAMLLAGLNAGGCADKEKLLPESGRRNDESRRVFGKGCKFSLVPPEGWKKRDDITANILNYEAEGDGAIKPSFTVGVDPYTGKPPIETFGQHFRQPAPRQFPGWQVVDDGLITIDGRQAYFICASFDAQAGRAQGLHYFIPDGKGKLYAISFMAPAASFTEYRGVFEKVAESVRTD